MTAILFAEQASAHGRMTKPMTRIGSATAYENDPIGFQGRSMTHFACRNGKNPNVQPTEYTAGDTITLEWDLTANHIGDAGIYISYDHDVPHSSIYNMNFFKIANIPKARDHKKSLGLDYQITLPSWLPGGKAVLRWEWYALHVNPTIELYAQCADIIITPGASPVDLSEIAMYPVVDASGNTKTLPLYNTDMAIYRDGFNEASPQWLTGPACARDSDLNDCAATAVGTKGNINPLTGGNSGGGDLVTPAPVTPTPAPVDNPTEPPTDNSNHTPNPSGITQRFFLDASSDFNARKTLANIGGLLAQCAWESGGEAPWHACDENNWSGSATASCSQRADGTTYNDVTGPGACAVDPAMQMTAVTAGSPTWQTIPLECTPGTSTEGCCWWGRGAIQTTGPLNYGKLNTEVLQKMGSSHDICTNPEAICQEDELKFMGTVFYWTEEVQKDACFEDAINDYAQAFNNVDHSPSDGCYKFSSGIGGRINNGAWNSHAHGETGRQTQFTHMMTYLQQGYDHYDGAHPNTCCTGNDKIDRMLELANIKDESAMEGYGVYSWNSFCETIRLFTDDADACSTGNGDNGSTIDGETPVTPTPAPQTTPSPVAPTPAPVDDGTCSHQIAGERCTTTGEAGIETCCAAGHYCHVYSQWWSSCTLGSDPNGPSTPAPVEAPVTAPTSTPAPVEAPVTAPTQPVTTLPPPTGSPVDQPTTGECTCVSKVGHISDEWCQASNCDAVYADFCELSCDGTPAPQPTTTGAPATTTGAAPAPTNSPVEAPVTSPTAPVTTAAPVTAPTQPVTTLPPPTPTGSPVTNPTNPSTDEFVIMGYVENWKSFSDMSKFDSYTHLLYSFLTLDSAPFPDDPRDIQWDGQAIYETMTLADVLDVMQLCDGCAAYENPHNWQRQKIVDLMDYCAENGKTFLWAFGGWSDLKRTIADDQVDTLVAMLVELLETVGGDGIDFDWEHLSEYKDIDNALHAQQRQIVGKVIVALKDALVARGMADKLITYTPRYNAFLEGGAYNTNEFRTDGEGIDIVEYVVANSAHGVDAIDFVHYMMYDINAQEGFKNAPEEYFVEEHYDAVIQSSLDYIPASKIVIGFESGPQAYTGVSGGVEHEKNMISYIMDRVGGVMFWAANEAAIASNGQTTGQNSGTLAAYAAALLE